jgi:hypothetical protein
MTVLLRCRRAPLSRVASRPEVSLLEAAGATLDVTSGAEADRQVGRERKFQSGMEIRNGNSFLNIVMCTINKFVLKQLNNISWNKSFVVISWNKSFVVIS